MYRARLKTRETVDTFVAPYGAIRLPDGFYTKTGWSLLAVTERHRFLFGDQGIARWSGRGYRGDTDLEVRIETQRAHHQPTALHEEATKAVRERNDEVPFELRRFGEKPVPLDGTAWVIGRHPHCDIVVSDAQVSPFHAICVPHKARIELYDLDSLNGTILNGHRISRARFWNGRVTMGQTTLSFGRCESDGGIVDLPSSAMIDVYDEVSRVAPSDVSVMILGESGSGKDVIARRIHRESGRSGRFVALNAAGIQVSLATSELFGHMQGAYTGAVKDHLGAFREAHRGTLFLDEIGDMAMKTQVELLRAVESQTVRPVGSVEAIPVDVRIVAATNRNLEQAVAEGSFREDLYHRLVVIPLEIPPLRERVADIPVLAEHFLARDPVPRKLTLRAVERLKSHRWPGNVRELANTLKRTAVSTDKLVIDAPDLAIYKAKLPPTPISHLLHDAIIETHERVGCLAETAKILGLRRPVVRHHVDLWERKKKLNLL